MSKKRRRQGVGREEGGAVGGPATPPGPATPSGPDAGAVGPGALRHLQALTVGSRSRWLAPLLAAVAALAVGTWTFDSKLSLSGDNTEFVTLARSLAAGEGLTYTNLPEPRPATKYPFGFPLLLAPVAAAFGGWDGTGTPDWVAMKVVVLLSFAAAAAALAAWARSTGGPLTAWAATAVAITNPVTVSYASQVMSEVPYLAVSLLALGLLQRGLAVPGWRANRWLWAGLAAALAAYYLRSVGVVLLGAVGATLLLRRDWERAGVVAAVSLAGLLPWALRNSAVGGGGFYLKQLVQVNPYFPEQGYLDAAGMWQRAVQHVGYYLSEGLTGALWPTFVPSGHSLTPHSVALLALLGFFAWRHARRHTLPLLYAGFFLITVVLWPWTGERFLLPLLPVLIWFLAHAVADGIAWLRAKGAGPTAMVLGAVLLGLAVQANVRGRRAPQGVPASLLQLARDSRADYRPEWRNYYEAGLWLRANTPDDAVVTCRKAFWMHVVSGRRTFVYAFDGPAALIADLEAHGTTHAVIEQLGYSHTGRFLVPAIQSAPERFPVLWHRAGPDTYVVGFAAGDS